MLQVTNSSTAYFDSIIDSFQLSPVTSSNQIAGMNNGGDNISESPEQLISTNEQHAPDVQVIPLAKLNIWTEL